MALVVGTNSYVDVAEADLYFTDRLYSDNWTSASAEIKSSALITACTVLETLCIWDYSKTDSEQDLEFPRNGETEVLNAVKIAQMEIALEMITQEAVSFTEEEDELKQIKAGSASISLYEKISNPMTIINSITKAQLSPLGLCNFGGSTINSVKLIR